MSHLYFTPQGECSLRAGILPFIFWITPPPLNIHCTCAEKSAVRVLDWGVIVERKRKEWRNDGRKKRKEEEGEGDLMQALIYMNYVTHDVMTFYKVYEQSGNTG